MIILAMRAIIWTFQSIPYQRIYRSGMSLHSSYSQILLDAADLSLNLRGIGWSGHPIVPTESRPPLTFFLHTLVSFLSHVVLLDVAHRFVQLFGPNTIGSPVGGSIFDPSLPPLHRYSRSTLITFITGFMAYAAIQAILSVLGPLLSRFLTSFSLPMATYIRSPLVCYLTFSILVKRWHQLFKDIFVSFGGNILALLMGRVGRVLGAFFVSGVCTLLVCGAWVEEENSSK
jgi:hypothetical protein